MIRILFTVKSQTTQKIEFFSKGIRDSHNLMFETPVNADHEYLKISRSTLLDMLQEMLHFSQFLAFFLLTCTILCCGNSKI